ncbi:MAG: hypothetical protein LBD29_01545 [Treponema sp.]|jgi:hypothetical protein|nr:hypothetical protein [Treponema sp.]
MFSIKASGISAGIAFLLSLLIGFISGGSFFIVFLRAGACGAVFFLLIAGLYMIAHKFIPELFQAVQDEETKNENAPGSHVDISVQDEETQGAPETAAPPPEQEPPKESKPLVKDPDTAFKEAVAAALNPQELPSEAGAGLDQNHEKEYTQEEKATEAPVEAGVEAVPPESQPQPQQESAAPTVPEITVAPAASQSQEPELDPWEEISPPPAEGEHKPKLSIPAKAQSSNSGAQENKSQMDPKKLDPKQMASTIQNMLRQE